MVRGGIAVLVFAGVLSAAFINGRSETIKSTPPNHVVSIPLQNPSASSAPLRIAQTKEVAGSDVVRSETPSLPAPTTKPTKTENRKKRETETVLTAAAIAALIVTASRSAYYATGKPCACPEDRMRNGRSCGSRSAYSRPGGAAPLCFTSQVTSTMIEQYRSRQAMR